jgi:hypothetical protein
MSIPWWFWVIVVIEFIFGVATIVSAILAKIAVEDCIKAKYRDVKQKEPEGV